MPSGPSAACSTSGASGSIVITTSLAAATARGEAAAVAPASTSEATAFGLTSCTVSRWPFLRTLRAIGPPIVPSPMKPTSVIASPPSRRARSRPVLPLVELPHRQPSQVLRVLGLEGRCVGLSPALLPRLLLQRRGEAEGLAQLRPGERLLDQLALDHEFGNLED